MNAEREWVKPNDLYPVVTLESFDPQILDKVVEDMKKGIKVAPVKVIRYEGHYFVLEGNYEMLAANIMKEQGIEIEIVNRLDLNFWNKEENIKSQLKAVGMNALYDFESIGRFTYSEYPSLYKGE